MKTEVTNDYKYTKEELGMNLGEYHEKCYKRVDVAKALVKERITGTRKGLPESENYLHSYRVMDIVSKNHHWDDPDYDLFTAALLHDIVEDEGVTFTDLIAMGFTPRTIALVDLCSHSLEITDSTERWMLMIAKLIKANDEDAWRIKIADLADNLTESHGLEPESRRFMIEVKAPLLLRLTKDVPYSARKLLEDEMSRQRILLSEATS